MNKTNKEIPEIDLKLESKEIKSRIVKVNVPYVFLETPYIILSDKDGTRRIWTKSKKKIILYYLWKITKIKWFVNKYNKLPRG